MYGQSTVDLNLLSEIHGKVKKLLKVCTMCGVS